MNRRQRIALFFLVCIPVRTLLTLLAFFLCDAPRGVLFAFSFYCTFVSLSFLGQMYRRPTVGGFGGPVWWSENRIVHVVMYLLTALLVHVRCDYAWIPLMADVFLGLVAGIHHYGRGR